MEDRAGSGRSRVLAVKSNRRAFWLVAPTMAILAVVIGYPVLRAVYLSFQAERGINEDTGRFEAGGFAGFDHYLMWLTQRCGDVTCPPGTLGADFWPAVGTTFFFAVVTVSIEACLGLWMAIVMSRSFFGRSMLRASVLIPWAIPTAVTAKLWFFIFSENGIANKMLGTDIAWTTDPWASRFAVIIADVWKTAPFMALLILAGLQMIPKDTYEAARVDGASAWQRFTQITLPLVKPALMVAILFRTLDVLRMYDLPAILSGTSGSTPTTTVSILVVADMRAGNFNSASALSTLVFLMIFAVAFVMVKFLGANAVRTQENQRKGASL
ncbi:sugar ABC transporter permease [Rhodococcus rhodnii]|uniref:ABC sugar transporter n=2 Tax=Rhodococcus rhodnii TaxID=38312 RepID=R7WSB1_9NOCA|nr:sugar ABC transporter permease [Rhodococcus rhodnii]EOM76819.1 ABC sugar transporter [Rhodococcus rhodnii LMG 5362]TXG89800.1 sugar ABC transporter permease [Rhodococcus rhodnii]